MVGEIDTDGTIDIVGIVTPIKGLKKGVVVNIESTVNAIQRQSKKRSLWQAANPFRIRGNRR